MGEANKSRLFDVLLEKAMAHAIHLKVNEKFE